MVVRLLILDSKVVSVVVIDVLPNGVDFGRCENGNFPEKVITLS